uniref:Uncharacterized protein n=1 Tax=Rhizophora mucronata TaxID=61149 RepID=A0A2P2NT28_RHIMU
MHAANAKQLGTTYEYFCWRILYKGQGRYLCFIHNLNGQAFCKKLKKVKFEPPHCFQPTKLSLYFSRHTVITD